MLYLGEFQYLTIVRETPQGFYLEDDEKNEVLLPGVYRTPEMKLEEYVEVFVYADAQNRPVATTETPLLTVGTAAALEVAEVNEIGAFCKWGISKQLFVPFRNQQTPLQAGKTTVVYMYLDEQSQRLVGTTIFKNHFRELADDGLAMGQEVALIVAGQSELGYKVIINQTYLGLVYTNEADQKLSEGESLKGYIKPIRPDGKIDVSLYAVGAANIEPNAEKLLALLKSADGFLPFTDKSDPQTIRDTFGMSKKMFKKALGGLYRQKLVALEEEGVRLVG